jgi:hypothetical protein
MAVGTLVEIEWIDSASYDGWHSEREHLEFARDAERSTHLTIGYVLRWTRKTLAVVQSVGRLKNSGTSAESCMVIPQAAIVRVSKLKKP